MAGDFKKKVGNRLRELRESRGLTQAHVAELTTKTMETISNFERGVTTPSLRALADLAKALDVKVADIVDVLDSERSRTKTGQNLEEVVSVAKLLSPTDQALMIDFAKMLRSRSGKRRK